MFDKIKHSKKLVFLLFIILVLALTHIVVDYQMHRDEERLFVDRVYHSTYEIHTNLDCFLNGPEDGKSASLSGTKVSLYDYHKRFIIPDGYLQYNTIHKRDIFFSSGEYTQIRRFEDILLELLEKCSDGNTPSEKELKQLNRINTALEKWYNSFVDEDGDFIKTAYEKEYFQANYEEFIDTLLPW